VEEGGGEGGPVVLIVGGSWIPLLFCATLLFFVICLYIALGYGWILSLDSADYLLDGKDGKGVGFL